MLLEGVIMKIKDLARLLVVQTLCVFSIIIGACMEVQAMLNLYNWHSFSQKLGVALSVLGVVSLAISGVVLIGYGWVIGMLSVYWKREQR
jgi:hypothetical protein